mmetsp:Transcript_11786/g.25542  ORF Transcript_11786/g.25542 Transcript_11786/m.25542 type:complete len:236 (+) Transcript_11786:804-1511(+)
MVHVADDSATGRVWFRSAEGYFGVHSGLCGLRERLDPFVQHLYCRSAHDCQADLTARSFHTAHHLKPSGSQRDRDRRVLSVLRPRHGRHDFGSLRVRRNCRSILKRRKQSRNVWREQRFRRVNCDTPHIVVAVAQLQLELRRADQRVLIARKPSSAVRAALFRFKYNFNILDDRAAVKLIVACVAAHRPLRTGIVSRNPACGCDCWCWCGVRTHRNRDRLLFTQRPLFSDPNPRS